MSQKDISKEFKRSDFGLPDKAFVYCSFNNNYKITPHIFDIWMNILKNVPNSVLWIFKSNETATINLKETVLRELTLIELFLHLILMMNI